jgi:hypothetical protein
LPPLYLHDQRGGGGDRECAVAALSFAINNIADYDHRMRTTGRFGQKTALLAA